MIENRQERRRQKRIHDQYDEHHRFHEVRTMLGQLNKRALSDPNVDRSLLEMATNQRFIQDLIIKTFSNGNVTLAEAIVLSRLQALLFLKTNKVTMLLQGPWGEVIRDPSSGKPRLSCIVCSKDPFTSCLYTAEIDDPNERAYVYVVCKDHFVGYLEGKQKDETTTEIEKVIDYAKQRRINDGMP
jgi:hypothetical protein